MINANPPKNQGVSSKPRRIFDDPQTWLEAIAQQTGCKRGTGGQYIEGSCPYHGGRGNFSVKMGNNGKPLVHCFTCGDAGQANILDALGQIGLWPEPGEGGSATTAERAAESIARRRAEEARKEAERQKEQTQAARRAQDILDKATTLEPQAHPHNQERGGRWTGAAQRGEWPQNGGHADALLLPLKDTNGELWSIQAICGHKQKYLLAGGAKRGNYFSFAPYGEAGAATFYIGEGFFTVQAALTATRAALQDAHTRFGWIVAIDAGNLEPVALAIHTAHPAAKIIILADEDQAGIKAANRAAAATGGEVARPRAGLNGREPREHYDFDDLLNEAGAAAVQTALRSARRPEPEFVKDAAEAAYQEQSDTRENRAEQLANAIMAGAQPATDRTEEPPPIKYIIRPQLTDDTGVSFFIGPGGSGKSFQALTRCIAITSGRPIGKAHQTEVTAPACFFSLEDPPNVLKRRYYHTIAAIEETFGPFSTGELAALDANLFRFPVRGQMGALMELDGKGNPRPTENYHALRKIIERIKPAFIVLDTMSRALGVDENSNAHAAQWITALEEILFDHPGTVFQVVGHTGKGNQDGKDEDPASIRGASAFAWNARAVEIYTKATDKDKKALGIDPGTEVFKLYLGKHNYSVGLEAIFFTRNEHGVPIEIDAEAMKTAKARDAYEQAIRAVPEIAKAWQDKGKPLNKRKWERRQGEDMTDPAKPKPGREQLAHDALTAKGITSEQVATAIKEAIDRGYVEAVEIKEEGRGGRAPVAIRFLRLPPELDE